MTLRLRPWNTPFHTQSTTEIEPKCNQDQNSFKIKTTRNRTRQQKKGSWPIDPSVNSPDPALLRGLNLSIRKWFCVSIGEVGSRLTMNQKEPAQWPALCLSLRNSAPTIRSHRYSKAIDGSRRAALPPEGSAALQRLFQRLSGR